MYRKRYGNNHTDTDIKFFSERKWKGLVKKNIKNYLCKELLNIARTKTKTIKVSEKSTDGELSQQPYILRFPLATARRAFEIHLSMMDLKVNFKINTKMTLLVEYAGWRMRLCSISFSVRHMGRLKCGN